MSLRELERRIDALEDLQERRPSGRRSVEIRRLKRKREPVTDLLADAIDKIRSSRDRVSTIKDTKRAVGKLNRSIDLIKAVMSDKRFI